MTDGERTRLALPSWRLDMHSRQVLRIWPVIVLALSAAALLSALVSGQSDNHINTCNDISKRILEAEKDHLDMEKSALQSNTAFENELQTLMDKYSARDSAAVEEAIWRTELKYLRQSMSDCSYTMDREEVARTLRDIGEALTHLNEAEDAIPVLRRSIETKPDDPQTWLRLGEANEALNRFSEAKSAYRKAIEIGGFDELSATNITLAKICLALLEIRESGQTPRDFPECDIKNDEIFLPCVERHLDKSARGSEEHSNPRTDHSFGTGFFVSSDGGVLTNNHVVAGCKTIATRDGSPLRLVSRSVGSDLALLKADSAPSTVAAFRSGPPPKVGDTVVAFGFPLPGLLSSEGNVSTGILSATSGLQNDIRFVQISAPVQPGNSGGPLFDSSGNVIGVVVGKLDALEVAHATGDIPQNVNFAIHWSEVRAFLDEQGIQYRKEPSQHTSRTRDIAATAAKISVELDCTK